MPSNQFHFIRSFLFCLSLWIHTLYDFFANSDELFFGIEKRQNPNEWRMENENDRKTAWLICIRDTRAISKRIQKQLVWCRMPLPPLLPLPLCAGARCHEIALFAQQRMRMIKYTKEQHKMTAPAATIYDNTSTIKNMIHKFVDEKKLPRPLSSSSSGSKRQREKIRFENNVCGRKCVSECVCISKTTSTSVESWSWYI